METREKFSLLFMSSGEFSQVAVVNVVVVVDQKDCETCKSYDEIENCYCTLQLLTSFGFTLTALDVLNLQFIIVLLTSLAASYLLAWVELNFSKSMCGCLK